MVSLRVCVGDVQFPKAVKPKGTMTEAQKGLRERNMSLYSVRNYLLRFRRISGVKIERDSQHSHDLPVPPILTQS